MKRMRAALLFLLAAPFVVSCAPSRIVAPLHYGDSPMAEDTLLRQAPPPLPPIAEIVDAPPRETTLSNGLRIVLVERHDYPVVATRLIVDRSSLDVGDPGGKQVEQMQYLFSRWGDEETAEDAQAELADVSLRAGWSPDAVSWIAHAPTGQIDRAWGLLAERSFGAKLTPEEYKRRRARWMDLAKQRGPSLQDAESAILFGISRHAYAYVNKRAMISQEDAETLRARLLQPSQAVLLVIGDATPEEVDAAATRWFGGWQQTAPALARYAEAAPLRSGPKLAITRSHGLGQRRGAVFARGPEATSDDVEAFDVTAAILGSVGGKLFEKEREEMGASYMIESPVFKARSASWLVVAGSYNIDKALDGIEASLDGIRKLRDGEVTEDDVRVAQNRLLAIWRVAQSTVEGTANLYTSTLILGVGIDRARNFPARLARVGRVDVVRVAKQYLADEQLRVALTGGEHWHPTARLGLGEAVMIE
jgi:zinc protease